MFPRRGNMATRFHNENIQRRRGITTAGPGRIELVTVAAGCVRLRDPRATGASGAKATPVAPEGGASASCSDGRRAPCVDFFFMEERESNARI